MNAIVRRVDPASLGMRRTAMPVSRRACPTLQLPALGAQSLRGRRQRSGTVVIWCAVLLPVLIGMAGLVIDGGLMMTAFREAQNAADAAAMAAANDLLYASTNATAKTDAINFVQSATYNNLPNATVTVNIPPTSGPYAGISDYAQVSVTCPLTTYFMQILPGLSKNQSVTASAVAGIGSTSIDAGVMALSSTGTGLSVQGSATLDVPGTILVNSSSSAAVQVGGSATIITSDLSITGGDTITCSAKIHNVSGSSSPVETGVSPSPDQFGYLPTPTTGNVVVSTTYANPNIGGSSPVTLNPGIYINGITIQGSATVTLNPGVYVLKGSTNVGGTNYGLYVGGSATVSDGGKGVMFYNTGADYNASSGAPDASDPADPFNQSPPAADPSGNFGGIFIAGSATVSVSPYTNSASSFDGVVYYQRRANTQPINITGSAVNATNGTIYGKWAPLILSGSMSNGAQFIVNTVNMSGSGTVLININYKGEHLGKAPAVYLVD